MGFLSSILGTTDSQSATDIDDPMRLNPAPYGDRADAVAYVDEVQYLTEDDVVELSAFDRELAEQYPGDLVE